MLPDGRTAPARYAMSTQVLTLANMEASGNVLIERANALRIYAQGGHSATYETYSVRDGHEDCNFVNGRCTHIEK